MIELTDYATHMERASLRERLTMSMNAAMVHNRRPGNLMMTPTDWQGVDHSGGWFVEEKHDGIHTAFSARAAAPAFTREGSPFMAASHLFHPLRAVERQLQAMTGQPHLLFGEYVHPDGVDAAIGDFQRGEGSGGMMLFDAVSDDAWRGRVPSLPLLDRRQMLVRAVAMAGVRLTADGVAATESSLYVSPTADTVRRVVEALWKEGCEGLVIKDAASPYVRGPSPHWQRLKRTETEDLAIEDVDVRDGRLRAFTVSPAAGVVTRIGRGISDALRAAPHLFRRGRKVEVKHLGRTKSGSFKSASFLRFRDDK